MTSLLRNSLFRSSLRPRCWRSCPRPPQEAEQEGRHQGGQGGQGRASQGVQGERRNVLFLQMMN